VQESVASNLGSTARDLVHEVALESNHLQEVNIQ
jgi:hypothetical protein